MKNSAKKIFEEAAAKVLGLMESEGSNWLKPFSSMASQQNPLSKTSYRGFNRIYLSLVQSEEEYSSPYWATYKQLKSKRLWIKKDEVKKTTPVFFYSMIEKEDEDTGEKIKYPMLKVFRVYNADQLEDPGALKIIAGEINFDTKISSSSETLIEELTTTLGVKLANGSPAYYPGTNKVTMLPQEKFIGEDEYFSTFFHELVHFTGDKARLNRNLSAEKEIYATEELVAEIGSAMMCGYFGYSKPEVDANHAKYLNHWIQSIKNEPRILMRCCTAAEKACDFIVGKYSLAKIKTSAGFS